MRMCKYPLVNENTMLVNVKSTTEIPVAVQPTVAAVTVLVFYKMVRTD